MCKGQNCNHPKKGDMIRVQPITNIKNLKAIKKLLADKPRDLALFTVGINTNLRASDLLQIKAGMVRHLKPMDEIELKEKKTGKLRRISLNKSCTDAIQALLKFCQYRDDEAIFSGQRGPVTVPTVNALVKSWCKTVNLQGNYGSHSLRKTFGYHQRVTFGRGVAELMVVFNHSSERQTLTYLGIQPSEIKSIYQNEI
jgi:integrase